MANRVLPALLDDVPDSDGPVAEAAALHQSLWSEQQEWGGKLEADRSLPYLFGTHTPAEVAEQLADVLEDGR